jgi:hypothetical protein
MDKHIRALDQCQQYREIFRLFDIQNRGQLASVDPKKCPTLSLEARGVFSKIISSGGFDFDDLGALICQQSTTIRTSNIGRHVNDTHTR